MDHSTAPATTSTDPPQLRLLAPASFNFAATITFPPLARRAPPPSPLHVAPSRTLPAPPPPAATPVAAAPVGSACTTRVGGSGRSDVCCEVGGGTQLRGSRRGTGDGGWAPPAPRGPRSFTPCRWSAGATARRGGSACAPQRSGGERMGAPRLWDTTAVGGRWRWRGWGWRRTAQESWEWGGTQEILTEGLHAPWVGSAKVPADVPCHSATRKFNRRQEKTTETEEHHREALDGASVAVRRVDPNQIRLPRSQRMPTISALDPARHPTFQHHNNTHAVILLWARSGVVYSPHDGSVSLVFTVFEV